jgi:hypothetical protein
LATGGTLSDKVHVGGCVEGVKLLFSCNAWVEDVNAFIQATRLELAYERSVAVRTKGMAVTEAVASQAVADDDCHGVRRRVGFHEVGIPLTGANE